MYHTADVGPLKKKQFISIYLHSFFQHNNLQWNWLYLQQGLDLRVETFVQTVCIKQLKQIYI